MPARPNDAATFHALHRELLILPNVWDAGSAKTIELAGAKAIATSSAAVAWSHGRSDGHGLPIEKLVATVAEIARVTALPITADAEAGYADDLDKVADNISALIQAGAVGINLEDGTAPHDLHLKKIAAARKAGQREGVELYINARTDVFLKQLVEPGLQVAEAIKRGRAIRDAGASGLFVPAIAAADDIAQVVQGVALPLNVMGRPGLPKLAELKALGVKRISAATATYAVAMEALRAASAAFLVDADADALWAKRGSPPNWNELFAAKG
ncbi:MAG: isocitrate lyase/phosphoenolpyruvate mutase family protein [Hyphomonadaceae bacterium]|nr:isocitrate lyase/phosphoenolpyruvate mutase family protein [Hyphomonadaceae bacterium]